MRRSLPAARPGTPAPSSRRLRRVAPVALVAAVFALSGCQTQSPIQTDQAYAPADGVAVDLGAVQLRDLVVVSGGKDKAGTLSGSLINTSGDDQRVGFALENAQPVFTDARANSQEQLSGSSQVQLPAVPAEAGDTVTLTVQAASAPAQVVVVPVVASAGYYGTMSPTAVPTTSTATAGGTPAETTTTTQ